MSLSSRELFGGHLSAREAYRIRNKFSPATRTQWQQDALSAAHKLTVRHTGPDGRDVTVTAASLLRYAVTPMAPAKVESMEENVRILKQRSEVKLEVKEEPPQSGAAPILRMGGKPMEVLTPTSPTKSVKEQSLRTPRGGSNKEKQTDLARLEAMMAGLMAEMKSLKAENAKLQDSEGVLFREREDWVTTEELDALEKKCFRRFIVVSTGQPEHDMVHQMRTAYWEILTDSLGEDYSYLTEGLIVGDVRQLWTAVSDVDQVNTNITAVQIEQKIRNLIKTKEKGYPAWQRKLDAFYEQLRVVRHPKDNKAKVFDIALLLTDGRYASVIKKASRVKELKYERLKTQLHARAFRTPTTRKVVVGRGATARMLRAQTPPSAKQAEREEAAKAEAAAEEAAAKPGMVMPKMHVGESRGRALTISQVHASSQMMSAPYDVPPQR